MKSWKEVPHLFANGKFEIQTNLEDVPDNQVLVGCIGEEKNLLLYDGNFIDSQNTYLIARPISDMSDEERRTYNNLLISNADVDPIYGISGNFVDIEPEETPESFLYLLSIGCYPFNQDNPKDVIWTFKNKN